MGFESVKFALQTDDVVGFTEEQRTALEMQMLFSVSAEGTNLYKNFKFPRYKNFYGYAQLMSGAFVVRSIPLEYLNQEVVHWHQFDTEMLQSQTCDTKLILSKLPTPYEVAVSLRLIRQRYTSVRFRLQPGITANIQLLWNVAEPVCGETIAQPDEAQGRPPLNDNKAPAQPNRPAGQPQDERDTSKNDGKDDPLDNRPPEPKPGDQPGVPGQWYAIYNGFLPGCQTYEGFGELLIQGATDGSVAPVLTMTGQGTCGPTSFNGEASYKGVVFNSPRDYRTYTFEFRPGG